MVRDGRLGCRAGRGCVGRSDRPGPSLTRAGARTYVPPMATRTQRRRAAAELRNIIDSRLFKALCEPTRVDLVAFLTAEGRSDVSAIAAHFPQHATVISRHLAILHDAGVLRRTKEGRHVYFEMDGPGMVDRMEKILDRFRAILPLCCPAGE